MNPKNSFRKPKSNVKMAQQDKETIYEGANLDSKKFVFQQLIRLAELGKIQLEGDFEKALSDKTNHIFKEVFELKSSNIARIV